MNLATAREHAISQLDFQAVAAYLLNDVRDILPRWLPGGKLVGSEYTCADFTGRQGGSLKINIHTGKWADFATNHKGGDLISLYAAIKNISQGEALKELNDRYEPRQTIKPQQQSKPQLKPQAPPKSAPLPPTLRKGSQHKQTKYIYHDNKGDPLLYVIRIDKTDGSKTYRPWSWDKDQNDWVAKAWPNNRPLYNLHHLNNFKTKPVLVVEGEKAADHAQKYAGEKYVITTWQSGSNAWKKTDWSPLKNRNVLLWPDADQSGREAMQEIGTYLSPLTKSLRILNTEDLPEKHDAADFNFDWDEFRDWAKKRARDFNQKTVTEVLPPAGHDLNSLPLYEKWDTLQIKRTRTGPIINEANVRRVIENHPDLQDLIWYDSFHMKYCTRWITGRVREWSDADDLELLQVFQQQLDLDKMTLPIINRGAVAYANSNVKNEVRSWISSQVWDNTERVTNFFHLYMGAPDNEYTRAISKNFWVSIIARAFRPGCKADNMVILEGAQGTYKSTALHVIGGSWYVETNENFAHKDFYQVLQGKLIIEIGELDSFNKAETTTIKKVISTANDRYRPPYGRAPKDHPRQCIFVGTTNESEYLQDATGARRFWPVAVHNIQIERLKRDRSQLFAEAYHLFKSGHNWHEVPLSAIKEQEKRRERDVWEDYLESFLDGRYEVTIPEILQHLSIEPGRADKRTRNRIGRILRATGWQDGGTKRIMGRKTRIYVPSEPPPQGRMDLDGSDDNSSTERESVPNYAPYSP